jgi:2,6-dihydroxypseudooxynicotine hydrolase
MPDRQLEAVLINWAPRFILRGVDSNDFLRTTSRLDGWSQWHAAWRALGDRHAELARSSAGLTAGQAWVRASLAYHFARFLWEVPQEYDATSRLAVSAMASALDLLEPGWDRVEVPFGDSRLVGNLRRPAGSARPPLVLLVPGLDSTKEEFHHWERAYLERGLATLSIDGPGQGEGGYELPIEPSYERSVAAFLDHLAGRPDLDLDRVGAVGVSLGGWYVVRAAAFEPRIRAAVAVGGFYSVGGDWARLPAMSAAKFLKHSRTADLEAARALATRMTLEGVAGRVRQPLLLVFGDQDGLASIEGQQRLRREAPDCELWLFPRGNHGVTNFPYLHIGPAADWLAAKLRRSA